MDELELRDAVTELYFFHHGSCGSFMNALFEAFYRADSDNFDKLAKGFPHQATAIAKWCTAGDNGNKLFEQYGLIHR